MIPLAFAIISICAVHLKLNGSTFKLHECTRRKHTPSSNLFTQSGTSVQYFLNYCIVIYPYDLLKTQSRTEWMLAFYCSYWGRTSRCSCTDWKDWKACVSIAQLDSLEFKSFWSQASPKNTHTLKITCLHSADDSREMKGFDEVLGSSRRMFPFIWDVIAEIQ